MAWQEMKMNWQNKLSISTKHPQPTCTMGSVPRRPSRWQRQQHQQWDLSNQAEALDRHKLQVPRLSCIRKGFQAWNTLQDSIDDSSLDKVETSLERQEHFSLFRDTTHALPCNIHLPVYLWIMDPHSRAAKNNTSHGSEVLPQDTTHLIQRPCYQRGSLYPSRQSDHTKTFWPSKEMQTKSMDMSPVHQVWPKPSFMAQCKGEEDKADRKRGRATTSWNGQALSSPNPGGRWRTEKKKSGGNWFICGVPTTPVVEGHIMRWWWQFILGTAWPAKSDTRIISAVLQCFSLGTKSVGKWSNHHVLVKLFLCMS